MIFSEASMKVVKEIRNILLEFCNWSGQNKNYHKSFILFGKAVKRRKKKIISRLIGFKPVKEMNYLGVKVALRRLVGADFHNILHQLWGNLILWGINLFFLNLLSSWF
ncbi:hypothetical protein KFK09_012155 [Dendrobium nobile]|uniref:Uncharacterized protein n=1 Tax=Dendrobium nobile TaxID=94219 RepID=A0A8T3BI34_DENNO|nr:hypothetical protein KFK09_012155 [Dendrobium nobile]